MILKAGMASYGVVVAGALASQDVAAILTAVASTGIATAYVTYHEFYVRPAKSKELAELHRTHADRVDRIRRESQEDTERQLAQQYIHLMSINDDLKKRIAKLEKAIDN